MTQKIIRFLLVGIVNTLVGLGLTLLLYHGFQTGYWVATAFGNGCGIVISYLLNRRFTFSATTSLKTDWIRFLLVVLISYLIAYRLSLFVIDLFVPSFGGTGAILIGMVLYTILNFIGQNYWVFKKPS
ncbi:GtrA family protein [Exiguobacterium sp. RIT594]|uniref:GtrA family protein n=1 Tax=Exiguobacterium sp. RIT594 TaxID=2282449 RepID=UPI000DF84FB7|nr:GtrA family protein [Exiguobacterium sp. RIT594]RDB34098.1 GtrA family protein [Exiguobacterium sp. RIT594]